MEVHARTELREQIAETLDDFGVTVTGELVEELAAIYPANTVGWIILGLVLVAFIGVFALVYLSVMGA